MANDRTILRELSRQVADIAALPVMQQRRDLWLAHNALRPVRPMVLAFPEGCWPELVPDSTLRCRNQQFRRWEWRLRSTIFHHQHIGDDQVIEAVFDVPWRVHIGGYGVEIPRIWGDDRGSFVWDPPIKDLERDLDKLRPRELSVDRERTLKDLHRAQETFGDILRPRIGGPLWWTLGLTQDAAYLVGIEQMMMAMMDQPQLVHRLMAFLRDEQMRLVDWAEGEGLLSSNSGANGVGSGGFGLTGELPAGSAEPVPPGARAVEMWGFGESQETVGISPAMFDEFVLPYQVPLLEKFGLNYYGCCEQLEHRIDLVMRKIPRLRRVSVAPKANQRALAEKLAGRFVYCRKSDPVPVCVNFNEQEIRRDIRSTLEVTRGQPVELIMKDTHTVQHQPWRIGRWVRIAREEIAR